MSGFLLDTNVPSELMQPRPSPSVEQWLGRQEFDRLFVSVITLGELQKGIHLLPVQSARRTRLELWYSDRLLPQFSTHALEVTQPIAELWGSLAAKSRLQGHVLPSADGLIAATALVRDLTVVTRNVVDFKRTGVRILNPWEL